MDNTIADLQRLRERYSGLTDEELQAVADDAQDLTDVARTALQSEMLQRGLDIHLPQSPPPTASSETAEGFDPAGLDPAVICRVWDLDEARKTMGILRDAGIPCYLGPDNLEAADAFHSSFDDGVDIRVREVDQQHAMSTLSRALPPQPEAADYVGRCPKCHSTEIVFQNLDGNSGPGSSAKNFNWSCGACGYQWKDDGIEETN